MSDLFKTYPYKYIGYNTLEKPSTITNYCFYPDCPTQYFPYNDYTFQYTVNQLKNQLTGLYEYEKYYKPPPFPPVSVPVWNSNMKPLPSNYLNYNNN